MSFGIPLIATLQLGMRSLLQHKLRAALTMLGVLFGVSSVVAMLAIGEGASWEAQEQIRQLGSTNILIRQRETPGRPANQQPKPARRHLWPHDDDLDRINKRFPIFKKTVPIRELRVEVRAGTRVVNPRSSARWPNYMQVAGRHLDEGRFICDDDHVGAANICILGSDVARVLFPFESPLEKVVKIGPEAFGSSAPVRRAPPSSAPRRPPRTSKEKYSCLCERLRRWFGSITAKIRPGSRELEQVELHEILAKATDIDRVEAVAKAVREVVGRYHDEKKKDYEVVVPLELLQRARETKRIFNIVSRVDRRHFAPRRRHRHHERHARDRDRSARAKSAFAARSAQNAHIVAQFLVETVVLSACGGLLGIALGIAIPGVVEHLANIKTMITPTPTEIPKPTIGKSGVTIVLIFANVRRRPESRCRVRFLINPPHAERRPFLRGIARRCGAVLRRARGECRFRRALRHGREHDVHDADAADEERNAGDRPENNIKYTFRFASAL